MMYSNYIKVALRNLAKNRIYSVINIFGLSLGITACMLIVLYAKDDLSFDRFHANAERIWRVTADMVDPEGKTSHLGSTGMMPGPAFKDHIPEAEEFVRVQSAFVTVRNKEGAFGQEALWADESLFDVFTFPLLYGHPSTALKDLHSLVISEDLAKKYFGKTNVLGQRLEIMTGFTSQSFVVSGVVKNTPQNSSLRLGMVLPMKNRQLRDNDHHWINFYLNTFVKFREGTDIASVERRFAQVYAHESRDDLKQMEEQMQFRDKIYYHLQPLLNMHLSTEFPADNGLTGAGNPTGSLILSAIAVFLLIIASINFINLTVARSIKRAREIGVRKVVGGSRTQLIVQFLGESFVLSFFSFLFACLLTWLVLPVFNRLAGKELAFSYLLDTKLVAGYILLFLVTGLLAGFYPALVLSRFRPVDTLYGRLSFNGKNYLSRGLLVFQFTLSTFLIIATITLYRQFNYLVSFDLGYDRSNVVAVTFNMKKADELQILRRELLKSPAIESVTGDQDGSSYTLANINGGKEINFNIKYVDEHFFRLFKIPVMSGRNFSSSFSSDTSEAVVVNESFVEKAGWKKPLGEVVDFFYRNQKFRVIGVIRDYHYTDLSQKIGPQLFTIHPGWRYGRQFLRLKPGQTTAALAHLERTAKTLYPGQPFGYEFEDDSIRESYDKEARWKQIVAFAALLTIFVSCIGLFGLSVLSAEKRAKEIGIRKVLGASVASIAGKLSVDYLRLLLIAACIALPAGWWAMNIWLQDYPYRITLSPLFLAAAAGLVMVVGLLTLSFQSLKAALANPVKNLRTE